MDDAALHARIEALEAEVATLRKQVGRRPSDDELLKADEEQIAFGWGYVAKDNAGLQIVDWSGDVVKRAHELEKSAYDFVLNSRQGDHRHDGNPVATLVESMMFTPEKQQAMGIPEGILPSVGWWAGMKVHDPAVWADVRSGKLRSFSVGGRGLRVDL